MSRNRRETSLWLLTAGFALLPLLGWWATGLFDMDEGFYGAVTSEMIRRGEWITPYYNGHPWFEKPILLYWLAKPAVMLFGPEFGARLPSVLATLGVYFLVAWFARRRWGETTARWCVLVTASSLLIVGLGRLMMTDALLEFCLVGAFLTFWESLEGDRRWRWLSAFFLGLSVLAKGPVGVALFLPVVAWSFWREREMRPRFAGGWAVGTLIFLAAVASWYLPAYLDNGQVFVQKFLIEQNLNRFTGGDQAHTLPFLAGLPFYFVVLFIGLFPWSVSFRWKAAIESPVLRYLLAWAVVPLVFFTMSRAKLPHYILPACVPFAMLIAHRLARPSLRFPLVVAGVVAVVVNLAFFFYYGAFHREVHAIARFVRTQAQPDQDVAAYQMPRRQAALGTGRPEIQETSHPSLVMVLDRTVREPDDLAALLADPRAEWVITRRGRISTADIERAKQAGRALTPVATPFPQAHYRLFFLTPAVEPRN